MTADRRQLTSPFSKGFRNTTSLSLTGAFMKTCSKCLESKSLDNFSKQTKCNDGLNYWCKACYKEYRNNNIERIKKINAEWQKNNADKCNFNTAKWASKNKDKCNLKRKRWRLKNVEAANKITRRWRENNPEKVKFWSASWKSRNKEKVLVYSRNKHAKRKSSEGKYSLLDIKRIITSQKYKCVNCHKSVKQKYHIDHIKPLSKGGTNWPENIQILCPSCNIKKNAKDPIIWAQENGRLL